MPETIVPKEHVIDGHLYVLADSRHHDLLTVKEVAQLTGREVHTVYDAIKAGDLKARIPNGLKRGMRIRRADAMDWMEGTDAE